MTAGPLDPLTARTGPSVWTIPPGADFLSSLASELLQRFSGNQTDLANVTVFLPTRRAQRALTNSFLKLTRTPCLLPRLRTLGDVDEEDALDLEGVLPETDNSLPAANPLYRRLWFARLVQSFFTKRAPDHASPSWTTALNAADELATLVDALHAEEIPVEKVAGIFPESLALHWEQGAQFLQIATHAWADEKKRLGVLDAAERRSLLLHALSDLWSKKPAKNPVIIAGSTGSLPAVARLMQVTASMPKGLVILPGLDTSLKEEEWRALDDPHPQMGLKVLLESSFPDLDRQAVPVWPGCKTSKPTKRQELIRLALQPAYTTADWYQQVDHFKQTGASQEAIRGLTIMALPEEDREAEAIALTMREVLETKDKTAIFVTPDRALANRVSAKLQRWSITVNDSAGIEITKTPLGSFLMLLSQWLTNPSDPVFLMQMLRHPYCRCAMAETDYFAAIDAVDITLRGYRPGAGMEALGNRLRRGLRWHEFDEEANRGNDRQQKRWQKIEPLFNQLVEAASHWHQAARESRAVPAKKLLTVFIDIAEALARQADPSASLWRGAEGIAIAGFFQSCLDLDEALGEVSSKHFSEFLTGLMASLPAIRAHNTHPRLSILGPLEARLVHADRIILGGLNEGTWPSLGKQDPFLSRPMRAEIGLPSPERRIGLAAHDFAQLANAEEVFLTRSLRSDRAPSKPSRWLLRLLNIINGLELSARVDGTPQMLGWINALYTTKEAPKPLEGRPDPTPLVKYRPRQLSVTRVEVLLRDPYAIYAQYILNLKKMAPLDENATGALRGSLIHSVFAEITRSNFSQDTNALVEALNKAINARMDDGEFSPFLRHYWQERLQDSFSWFAAFQVQRRQHYPKAYIETAGSVNFSLPAGTFKLTARADRIDCSDHGQAAIIDYKSSIPGNDKILRHFNPQLFLMGYILQQGGFADVDAATPQQLSLLKFWNRKGDRFDELSFEGETLEQRIKEAADKLIKLLTSYDDPATSYPSQPRPQFENKYGDYDQLARRDEWIGAERESD